MGKGFSDYYTNREKALDLKKSAVLIVDMMNDFCKPGGRMVLEDGYLIVEPIQRLVAAARQRQAARPVPRRRCHARVPGERLPLGLRRPPSP